MDRTKTNSDYQLEHSLIKAPGVVKFLVLHNITVLTYQVCTVLVISYKVDSSFVDLESGSYPLST